MVAVAVAGASGQPRDDVTRWLAAAAAVWGLLDGEKPLLIHYVGFILIIGGVYLVTWPKKVVNRE